MQNTQFLTGGTHSGIHEEKMHADLSIGTVLASSLDHTFLDWTTLWGCLSKMADLAVGWVRIGGPIY